jgi:hypothetical protein
LGQVAPDVKDALLGALDPADLERGLGQIQGHRLEIFVPVTPQGQSRAATGVKHALTGLWRQRSGGRSNACHVKGIV